MKNNLLRTGADVVEGSFDERKLFFINTFSIVGIVAGIVFSAIYYFSGVMDWAIPAFVALGIVLVQIFMRLTRNIKLTGHVVVAFSALALGFQYFAGQKEGVGFVWAIVFPPIAYLFLKDKNKSVLWIISFATVILTASVMSHFGLSGHSSYSLLATSQLIGAIFLVSVLGYIYTDTLEGFLEKLRISKGRVEEVNFLLREQIAKREAVTGKFSEGVEKLERTKRAMLNLLEDARDLEKQLKEEKHGVEKKVEERTKELREAQERISHGWFMVQEEKAKLSASINSLPLGFFMIDNKHNILTLNDALSETLGIDKEKIKFDVLDKIFQPFGFGMKNVCNHCRKDTKSFEKNEIQFGGKILRVFSTPALQEEEVIGTIVLVEDVTEQVLLERSKDEFFSIASHELRTPLTAIRGNASLLRQYFGDVIKKNKDVGEMVEDMQISSIRLIKIVNDFLDASRLEQGKMKFQKSVFKVGDLASEVAGSLNNLATKKGLLLTFKKPTVDYEVNLDREKTKQILINLVDNAIKYSSKGTISVEVKDARAYIEVRVIDTGSGIDQKNQNLLFHKFQQAGERILARDVTQGTGMGLYISQLLAKGMGGDTYLESSELGKGSVFVLALPKRSGQFENGKPEASIKKQ